MERDLQEDMKNSSWFMEKIKEDSYAQNIYAALCNMRWQPQDVWPVLKDEYWTCSWRSAGGIVAELQGHGDYLNWYCSGMGGLATYNGEEGEQTMLAKKHVPEGIVTDEVAEDLLKLGWVPSPWPDDKQ
jgi:hypothetical protein